MRPSLAVSASCRPLRPESLDSSPLVARPPLAGEFDGLTRADALRGLLDAHRREAERQARPLTARVRGWLQRRVLTVKVAL